MGHILRFGAYDRNCIWLHCQMVIHSTTSSQKLINGLNTSGTFYENGACREFGWRNNQPKKNCNHRSFLHNQQQTHGKTCSSDKPHLCLSVCSQCCGLLKWYVKFVCMYCYVRFLSKLWCCSFTLVRGRLVIPIYYFPTCSCCKGTHSPPNQIWLPKQEKSVKGKRGEKMQSQQDACLLKIL